MPAPDTQEKSAPSSDCSECSYCTNSNGFQRDTKTGVRVSVNLSHFFSDKRSRAFLWAPHGRCVQWLARRLVAAFALPDDIALMSRGHMLPVEEPLLMLDRDDPIDVVTASYMYTVCDKPEEQRLATQSQRNTAEPCPLTARDSPRPSSNYGSTMGLESNIPLRRSVQPETQYRRRNSGDERADNEEELARLKRRALRLLDEHCQLARAEGSDAADPAEPVAAKRARRRRRRRKPLPDHDQQLDADACSDAGSCSPAAVAAGTGARGAETRAPRLVRPLSPGAQCAS